MEIILLNFVERPFEEQGQGLGFPVGIWSSYLVCTGGGEPLEVAAAGGSNTAVPPLLAGFLPPSSARWRGPWS